MVKTRSVVYSLALLVGAWLCVYPIGVYAQDNSLRQSLAFEGGYPENVVVGSSTTADANDMLYAGLNSPNGIFWSDNFGDTWNAPTGKADFGTISDVQTSDTPGTAFMIGGINLYRTQNNGQTWEELTAVQNVAQFFATGSDGLVAVPTRDGTVSISTDDGDTFTSITASLLDVAITADNTILGLVQGSGDNASLYSLTTSGATDTGVAGAWSHVATHPTNGNFWVVSGTAGVSYTANGATGPFTAMTNPEGLSHAQKAVIRSSGRIYLGNDYSDDNGTTWVNASIQNWITFDDVNGYVYTQTDRGVGRSADNGATYTDKITGMTGVTVNDLSQDSSKEVVWLAAQGGFAKSENFASSIAAGTAPTWEFPINQNETVNTGDAVWVDPDQSNIVVAGASGTLFRTEDSGTTWSEGATGLDASNGSIFIDIVNYSGTSSVLYASYQYTEGGSNNDEVGGGVLQSTDGGITWTDLGMPNVPAGPLAVDSTGQLLVGVGVEQTSAEAMRGIYLYDGSNWTQLYSQGVLINALVYSSDTNTVFAVSSGADMGGGVYKSTDSGTWSQWSIVGGDTIPSDFWGQNVAINTKNSDQIFVSTARPSGTGYIYSCIISTDTCAIYYTGLKDETFNTMIFDGLVTGSNTGLYSYQSKAKLHLSKQSGQRQLIVTLKDKVTNAALNSRTIKLYRKSKKTGTFKFVEKKTIKHGEATFTVGAKGGIYQARWHATKADAGSYIAHTVSSNVTFKQL